MTMDIDLMKRSIQIAIDEMEWREDSNGDYIDKNGEHVTAQEFSEACLISYLVLQGDKK